jgi:hypothetical protein
LYDNGNAGEFFKFFINLRKLKFTYTDDFSAKFVDAIMPLKHLEKIDICQIYSLDFERNGVNFQLTKFLNNFNQVKDIKFPLLNMNCYDFQKKYPHIRFRWYTENDDPNSGMYEGEFNEKSEFKGKGIYYFKNGDRYEGDFILNMMHGRGNYFHSDGGRYEGTWINDVRQCQEGIYYFPNGSKYIGEFQNDDFDGNGIYYYSNGSRFEGEWKKGERKEGIYYYADGSKYEGKWKNYKIGNYYFEDGSICEREWKYLK